ncbi:unnamed protein product [Cyclocybe aegerita]|uniref:DUF6532 domain-containing protein n=1 Tax=Cyclocybe aegerita TaxID=1973307 RepID=A0A8S0W3K8_CYCAE|nr:unnamed protein product [Cyclocybe aegerita]
MCRFPVWETEANGGSAKYGNNKYSSDQPPDLFCLPLREAQKQKHALQRAQKRVAEELEARQLIEAAGTEPRQAKQKALADAQWLNGQPTQKRAPSPESESLAGDKSNIGTGRKKQKQQPDGIEDSDTQAGKAAAAKVTGKSRKDKHQPKRQYEPCESNNRLDTDAALAAADEHHRPLQKQTVKLPVKMAARKEQDEELTDDSVRPDDEDDEGQSEEEPDYTKMSATELMELMDNEAPAFPQEPVMDVQALFDVDEANIEMSSTRSSRSRGSLLGVSLPPTSESNGAILGDTDDEDALGPAPPLKANKKNNKGLKKREAKFRDERPSIISDEEREAVKPVKKDHHRKIPLQPHLASAQCSSQDDDDEDDDEDQKCWPVHAHLRGTGLLQQNIHIRTVCRDAIKMVETMIVTDWAWPELNCTAEYWREVLSRAAKALRNKDARYRDTYAQIKSDESFMKALGRWASGTNHIAIFQLGVRDSCKARVEALFEDDIYVYLGHWEDDVNGKPMWVVKAKEIYLNPALVSVLKEAFFDTPSAFGYKFKEFYVSLHPSPELSEKELTVPLVALAATGLYAGLYVWREGTQDKADKFEGDKYNSVFELHKKYLLDLKEKNIRKFHAVMSELYTRVTNEPKSNNATHKSGNPLSVMDLSGYE